ncbi:hypothetical protein H2248_010054 [Termitomyces sp. 'cryptogamus']|nr:hypothetical protein H2248_010054 [Termitomyces sp. 'cryptogamus']
MLATQRMSPPNSVFAGNQAGAPLPLIPRRLSRESSSSSSLPVKVVIQHSSPPLPLDDSGSSSSSDSGRPTVSIRAKRVCPEQPPQNDTTPRRAPLLYSPGVTLRPTTARNFSESHAQTSSASSGSSSLEPPSPSTISVSQSQPRLIRKKSGQLVKSSLKPSKSLSLLTPCSPYTHSRSAPDTPLHTPKNVHFDAQLEHVKLFLAEQKPLAVSRDGSPTEDTASGTDTDFPDWVFGTSSSPSTRKLIMHHVNRAPRLSANSNDVVLESLELSPDAPSVVGRVRVSNLAYTKSVVARFTFDAWQTTSEVSARYVSSPSPRTDIFVFSVRLNDLMARIDGKRMCLAMRYTVGGREIWDNNGGDDYLVEFGLESKSKDSEREVFEREREKERECEREDRSRRPTPDPTAIASLRSTLEKVVAPSPVPRYDFSQSLSSRWVPPTLLHTPVPQDSPNSAPSHAQVRTQSYPSPGTTPRPKSHANSNSNSIPWPRGVKEREKEKCQWTPPLGSPRDVSDEDRPLFAGVKYTRNDAGTENLSLPPNACTHTPTPTPRRHHRRGYFDVHHLNANGSVSGKGSGVRRTPPGSPPVGLVSESDDEESGSDEGEDEKTPMPGRCYSFPPTSTRTRTGMGSGIGTAGLGFFANSDARDAHGHPGLGRAGAGVGAGVALGQGVGIGMRIRMGIDAGVRMGEDSELSTPSFGSSRATSPSPSPSPSPTESELSTETDDTETETETETECEGGGRYKRIGANDSNGSYKEFLSRFCFFTGTATATGVGIFPDSSDSPPHALPLDSSHSSHSSHIRAHTYPHAQKRFIVPRTQSASEIIESPRPLLPLQERAMAVRSPSFDDVLLGSGAATPVGELSPPTMVQLCDARRVTQVLPASCLP